MKNAIQRYFHKKGAQKNHKTQTKEPPSESKYLDASGNFKDWVIDLARKRDTESWEASKKMKNTKSSKDLKRRTINA